MKTASVGSEVTDNDEIREHDNTVSVSYLINTESRQNMNTPGQRVQGSTVRGSRIAVVLARRGKKCQVI